MTKEHIEELKRELRKDIEVRENLKYRFLLDKFNWYIEVIGNDTYRLTVNKTDCIFYSRKALENILQKLANITIHSQNYID